MSLRRLMAVAALAAATLLGPGLGVAGAQQAIGPDQHFVGLVNGSNVDPVVTVVCAGPIYPGRTGPVAGGQTISVGQVAAGGGYTGPLSQVEAWLVPSVAVPVTASSSPPALTFTRYGVAQTIPSSFQAPCYGVGQVEFSPCPYLAPCVYGWAPDYVTVRFEDIAV
jgi:hypothetical protein